MGRQRHALVDTNGHSLFLSARPASVQHRDSRARGWRPCAAFPVITKLFTDIGYQGPRVATATGVAVVIVLCKPYLIGFAVQPPRWRRCAILCRR